jgi:hypothetical protein
MQDRQLDTFGRMNHVPKRETEQPGHILYALLDRDKRAGAPRVSCSPPRRMRQVLAALTFWYQSDSRSGYSMPGSGKCG